MTKKLIYVRNDNIQNYLLYGLQLVVVTLGQSIYYAYQSKFIKSPQRIRKYYYKTLGTS